RRSPARARPRAAPARARRRGLRAGGAWPGRSRRERREDARPAARALVEARQVVLLVRRMHPVVVEPEADEERVEPERALEVADDRDRASGADRHSLGPPLLRQGLLRLLEDRHVVWELDRLAALVTDDLDRA